MRNFLNAIALCCGVLASPLLADEVTREDLIAQIEAGGRNETSEERHEVEVDGCTLTTYRWLKREEPGWVLWMSFTIPMCTVDLVEFPNAGQLVHYHYVEENEPPTAYVFLEGKDGAGFRMEKPFLRKPRGEYEPSPRGDGTSYYFAETAAGLIEHHGENVRAKAEMFTKGYIRYVREYCTFTG
ncbi:MULTISPECIES: hypothetical protein [Leisingera]|jgi:hypothetical protein|uniref:hypothetical protein n=1 Tax=Leisingera TaxID=191028 RepID=UPI0011534437|nr:MULTISPECIES: hypothetical protein [Leisingera]QDI77294.1 hypothetical protein R2C4_16550 [Leisingera aquaemixtae]